MSLEHILRLNEDGSAPAVMDAQMTLTRRELLDGARAVTADLARVVAADSRVGVIASAGVAGVTEVLGALLSGCSTALLPVDGVGSEDIVRTAREAGCTAMLRQGMIETIAGPVEPLVRPSHGVQPGEASEQLVLFTSGTTSRPRAARLSAANIAAHLTAMRRTATGWTPTDRVGQVLNMSHSFGISMALLALSCRAPLVMLPSTLPGRALADELRAFDVSVFACVPYFLRLMATRGVEPGALTTPRLRLLYLAGGGIGDADLDALLPAYQGEVYVMYGLTEATARVAVRRRGDGGPADSVGLPLPGVHVRIVGADGLPLPTGSTGRIQVYSPTLMIGYVGEPNRPRGESLTTTDLGRMDDEGNLFVTGREAEMMNFRGQRVSVVAVEALAGSVPGVDEALLRPDARQEDATAELLVVASGDADERSRIKRDLLRTLVPKGLVRKVTFVDDLPRTRSGKVLRH